MRVHVLRLKPGQDLREALQQEAILQQWRAACVVAAVGSFSQAVLRYAAEDAGTELNGPLELVTLSGTFEMGGMHLHASVSDARGEVRGGHLMPGCIVRTTAEVVIGLLEEWEFSRPVDEATGYRELLATRR